MMSSMQTTCNNNNLLMVGRYKYLMKNRALGREVDEEGKEQIKQEDERQDDVRPDSSQSPDQACTSALTRCPICQTHTADLPQHITVEHKLEIGQVSSSASTSLLNLVSRNPSSGSSSTSSSPPSSHLLLPHSQPLPQQIAAVVAAAAKPHGQMYLKRQHKQEPVDPSLPSFLLRTTSEMLRCASAGSGGIGSAPDDDERHAGLIPINLSMNSNKMEVNGFTQGLPQGLPLSGPPSDGGESTSSEHTTGSSIERKRRRQTQVPDAHKDERYWARRLKNNEAAKRSRDMRIKRERVVFEENQRLEKNRNELKEQVERLITENKELHLKMDLILDENARLKSLLLTNNNNNNNNNNRVNNGHATHETDVSDQHSPHKKRLFQNGQD